MLKSYSAEDRAAIYAFEKVARRFCHFVEADGKFDDVHKRLRMARQLLAELTAAGAALPSIDDDDADSQACSRDDYARPSTWVGFGEYDSYWKVFDPYVDEPRLRGSLTGDFTDVYLDVAPGLAAFDSGNELGAAWQWRFSFDFHSGDHAVGALRALQRACQQTEPS